MQEMIVAGRRFDTLQPVRLFLRDGRITRVEFVRLDERTRRWPIVAPGLCDLQVNGCLGREFASPELTSEDVRVIAEALFACGTTRFCPTITTEANDVIEHAASIIDRACRQWPELAARIAGIHVEGPYISVEDGPRGAHPKQFVRPPNWSEFIRWQTAAGGRIKLITLSPEYPEAEPFIRQVVAAGVVVSIGHLAASADQIRAAIAAGARLSTHLGNGAHPILPRHSNYIWNQLADDRLIASLIADGFHLPDDVLKVFVRAKSPQRCLLVSDLAAQAGLTPGHYRGQLGDVELLPEGRLVIADEPRLLAGAAAPLLSGVSHIVRVTGITLAAAVQMAAHQPAAVLGLAAPDLVPGEPANLFLFDPDSKSTSPCQGAFGSNTAVRCVIFGQAVWCSDSYSDCESVKVRP